MRALLAGRGWWIALALLVAALVFGSLQGGAEEGRSPERDSTDQRSFGFAAWVELLRDKGIAVEQLAAAPSDTNLDPETTLIALDIGEPTQADIESLRTFVNEGGYLITGGNTDRAAIRSITGLEPKLGDGAAGTLIPLLPVPQTEGVESVDGGGGRLFTDAANGLPAVGSDAGDLLLLGGPDGGGDGVALLASSNALANERLTFADNAQFAIDLGRAGNGDQPVLFLENLAIDSTPGEGVSALPSSWMAGFIGLVLAALVLVFSRLRRLGPPDGDPSPTARPRAGYVDALARVLARRGELEQAAEPVRQAAIEGIARRSGGAPAGDDADMLAAQAELAGVPADEAASLTAPLKEPEDAIRAARALARTRS